MKRVIRCVKSLADDEKLLQFSDNIAKQFPYMISYTADNPTYGHDFQRRAEELGCIKVEGQYQRRYQATIFYLAPSEDVYAELEELDVPTVRLGNVREYKGSQDYLLTSILTNCPQQKELRKLMRARF